MFKTLKGKIMAIILLALFVFNLGLSLFIYNTLYSSLKNNIKIDMESIRKFSVNTLKYSSLVIKDNTKIKDKTVYEINSNYNCYVGLYDAQNEKLDSKGNEYLESSIEKSLNNSKVKSSGIIFNKSNGFICTYVYPIYLSGEFDSSLVIQADYTKEYFNIMITMYKILTVQIILMLVIVIVLNFFVNRIIKPLKKLSEQMNKYGNGQDVDEIKAFSDDEIGLVTKSFNEMIIEKRKLENASKIFFNNATHELKTPVTSIYAYTQILSEEDINSLDVEFKKRAFNRISLECCKLRDLVQKLLELSRGGIRKKDFKKEFFLDELVSEICDRLVDRAARIGKEFEITTEKIKIYAVKEDLEQIILNLIDNALKYSKGKVINIKLKFDGERFFLEVKNEIGNIPNDIRENLLDPFVKYNEFQGKMEECISSSGLGLYLCCELAKKNSMILKYDVTGNNIVFTLSPD